MLGDNVFLTPEVVKQMRTVPELVFINCCHLGNSDESDNESQQRRAEFHQLASSLGTQFIEMGAVAVIAAGWALDDEMAGKFADTFYRCMLEGYAFGDAV